MAAIAYVMRVANTYTYDHVEKNDSDLISAITSSDYFFIRFKVAVDICNLVSRVRIVSI